MVDIGPPDEWKHKSKEDGTYAIAVALVYIEIKLGRIEESLDNICEILRHIRDK